MRPARITAGSTAFRTHRRDQLVPTIDAELIVMPVDRTIAYMTHGREDDVPECSK
jgi:hypothetical protein